MSLLCLASGLNSGAPANMYLAIKDESDNLSDTANQLSGGK